MAWWQIKHCSKHEQLYVQSDMSRKMVAPSYIGMQLRLDTGRPIVSKYINQIGLNNRLDRHPGVNSNFCIGDCLSLTRTQYAK